jgi:hypothetical protein
VIPGCPSYKHSAGVWSRIIFKALRNIKVIRAVGFVTHSVALWVSRSSSSRAHHSTAHDERSAYISIVYYAITRRWRQHFVISYGPWEVTVRARSYRPCSTGSCGKQASFWDRSRPWPSHADADYCNRRLKCGSVVFFRSLI